MKKILTFFLSLSFAASLLAQTSDDAINLAQQFREGTARTMAMGNAFTALGGDLGAVGINPASSGVMAYSQVAFTPTLTTVRSSSSYLGNTLDARNTGFNLSNIGTVLTFDTGRYRGLVNYSFGFVYNKVNNYRSVMKAAGTTDNSSMLSSIAAGLEGIPWTYIDLEKTSNPYTSSNAPWPGILAWNTYVLAPLSYLGGKYANVDDSYMASTENYDAVRDELVIGGPLDQYFNRKTRGSNQEFAFNFGMNFSDFVYVGANLNLYTISQITEEYYEEKAQNPAMFEDGFVSMDNSYWLRTSGAGANLKLGVIVTPVAGLRLGATLTTPTWYSLTDEWDYTMNTAFNNGNKYTEYSPNGNWDYSLSTPMRWSVGAAYTFWDRGLISVDYEMVNYASTRLHAVRNYGNDNLYAAENSDIATMYKNAGILRVGAEVRITDFLSLRGGYQHHASAVKGYDYHYAAWAPTRIYSAGIGFNISPMFSIDLAWQHQAAHSNQFQLYDNYSGYVSVPQGITTNSQNKAVCTLAFKF